MKKTIHYLAIFSLSALAVTFAHADGYMGHHLKPYPDYSGATSTQTDAGSSSWKKEGAAAPAPAPVSVSPATASSAKKTDAGASSFDYYKTGSMQ